MRGDVARATVLLEEGLASAKAFGITWDIPIAMTLLGHLAREQQHYALAKVRYREALTLYRAFSSPTYIASCLESFAATVCAEEHYAQTTRLYAAAAVLRKQTQTPLPPAEREEFEQTIATAKAALGEPAFVKEWNTGAALTQDAAIEDALSHSNS